MKKITMGAGATKTASSAKLSKANLATFLAKKSIAAAPPSFLPILKSNARALLTGKSMNLPTPNHPLLTTSSLTISTDAQYTDELPINYAFKMIGMPELADLNENVSIFKMSRVH